MLKEELMHNQRRAAYSIEIKDTEVIGVNEIVRLMALKYKCLSFSTGGIYQLILPENIDPENNYPDTKSTYKKLHSVGASNIYVARTIIQASEILKSVIFQKKITKADVLEKIWNSTEQLLSCENGLSKIIQQAILLGKESDKIITKNKLNPTLPGLPQIKELDEIVRNFFIQGKKFLKETYSLLEYFYELSNPIGVQFDKASKILSDEFNTDSPIVDFLSKNAEWTRFFSECRNAIEHEKKGQKITVRNITFIPGNKFSLPSWKYDLTNMQLGKQDEFSDLVADLSWFLENMLLFSEKLFLLCVQDNWNKKLPFAFYKIPDKKIDPKCPMNYQITLDVSKLELKK